MAGLATHLYSSEKMVLAGIPTHRPGKISRPTRSHLDVRAQKPEQPGREVGLHLVFKRLSKYDFVSTGLGAATVTSVYVAQGQDPFFALWLTFCATVAALALNEMLAEQR